jgi:predicted ArsR family transcriptional regulator
MTMTDQHVFPFSKSKITTRILVHIAKHPGATSASIAEALNIPFGSATGALTVLSEEKAVTRNKIGREYLYWLPTEKPEAGSSEVERLKAELAAAKAELAEAQAKHPDLVKTFDYEPYRPALNYLANTQWPDLREIREGRHFTTPQEAFIRDLIVVMSLMPQGDVA